MATPAIEKSVAEGRADVRRALRLRIISALFMVPAAVTGIVVGGRIFTAMVAFVAMIMVFEWARMVEGRAYTWRFAVLSVGAASTLILASMGYYAFALAMAGAAGALSLLPFGGFTFWPAIAAPYIIAPSAALIWLRFDPAYGQALTIVIFATVWAADTGAFVFGKFIGGPKISYALSPSKTWAGIGGGVVGGAVIGALAAYFLFGPHAAGPFLLAGGLLGAASVGGDLAESAFKRRFGVKDISGFIPGHGGVLDRLDGMIFTTVAMTGVYLLYNVFEKL